MCTYLGLVLFALILVSLTLQLDFGSSAQCSSVGLCLCFHQFLNESSLVRFKIFIDLTTGQGQLRHPLLYCLRVQAGSFLWIPGSLTSTSIIASPIMAPSFKISLSLLSGLSFLHLDYPTPSSSPPLSSSPLFFTFSHPFSSHPHAPNFVI